MLITAAFSFFRLVPHAIEQARFCFEVVFHPAMKIQMVLRQIRKSANVKCNFARPTLDLTHGRRPRSRRSGNPPRRTGSKVLVDQATPASFAEQVSTRSPISYWTVPIRPVDWFARSSRCLDKKVVVLLPFVPVTPIIFSLRDGIAEISRGQLGQRFT